VWAEQSAIDRIEIVASGHVQVRRVDTVTRNGRVIARTYHRHVLAPGDDVSHEDPRVAAVARAAWAAQE
jgi:hypothetical protein